MLNGRINYKGAIFSIVNCKKLPEGSHQLLDQWAARVGWFLPEKIGKLGQQTPGFFRGCIDIEVLPRSRIPATRIEVQPS